MSDEKRAEKLLRKLRPFLDDKIKNKQRMVALFNFLESANEKEQAKFFQEHDYQAYTVIYDSFAAQVEKIKAKDVKGDKQLSISAKEMVELFKILGVVRKVFVFLPEKLRNGWQRRSIVGLLQSLLAPNNHPRIRQEGFRLLLLWLNDHDHEIQEASSLYANAIPLNMFDSFALPQPVEVAIADCLGPEDQSSALPAWNQTPQSSENAPMSTSPSPSGTLGAANASGGAISGNSRSTSLYGAPSSNSSGQLAVDLGNSVQSPQPSQQQTAPSAIGSKGKVSQQIMEMEKRIHGHVPEPREKEITPVLPSPALPNTTDSLDLLEDALQNIVMLCVAAVAPLQHAPQTPTAGIEDTVASAVSSCAPGCAANFMWELLKRHYIRTLFPHVSRRIGLSVEDGEGYSTCPPSILQLFMSFLLRWCVDTSTPTSSTSPTLGPPALPSGSSSTSIMQPLASTQSVSSCDTTGSMLNTSPGTGNFLGITPGWGGSATQLQFRTGIAVRKILLGSEENREIVHEIIRQCLLMPFGYSEVTKCAIHVLRSWIMAPNDERPMFLRRTSGRISLDGPKALDMQTSSSDTKISPSAAPEIVVGSLESCAASLVSLNWAFTSTNLEPQTKRYPSNLIMQNVLPTIPSAASLYSGGAGVGVAVGESKQPQTIDEACSPRGSPTTPSVPELTSNERIRAALFPLEKSANMYLRRYIRYLRLVFLERKDHVEHSDIQLFLYREVINLYRAVSIEVNLIVEPESWVTLMFCLLDVQNQVMCLYPNNKFAVIHTPAIAEEVADMLVETVLCAWIRAAPRNSECWIRLREQLSKSTKWTQTVGQWAKIMQKMTKILSTQYFGCNLETPTILVKDEGSEPARPLRLRTYSVGASSAPPAASKRGPSRLTSTSAIVDSTVTHVVSTESAVSPTSSSGASATGFNASPVDVCGTTIGSPSPPPQSQAQANPTSQTTKSSLFSSGAFSAGSFTLKTAASDKPTESGFAASVGAGGNNNNAVLGPILGSLESEDGTSIASIAWFKEIKDDSPPDTPATSIRGKSSLFKDVKGSAASVLALSNEAISESLKVSMPSWYNNRVAEFSNLNHQVVWSGELACFLWKNMLCALGSVNEIPLPQNHADAIRALVQVWDSLEKIRNQQAFNGSPVPPLFDFAAWIFQAADMPKSVEFADGRDLAVELMCRIMCRRHDLPFPEQYYPHFYRIIIKGLSSDDHRLVVTILTNTVNIFTLTLPGSNILVYPFIRCIGRLCIREPTASSVSETVRQSAVTILSSIVSLGSILPEPKSRARKKSATTESQPDDSLLSASDDAGLSRLKVSSSTDPSRLGRAYSARSYSVLDRDGVPVRVGGKPARRASVHEHGSQTFENELQPPRQKVEAGVPVLDYSQLVKSSSSSLSQGSGLHSSSSLLGNIAPQMSQWGDPLRLSFEDVEVQVKETLLGILEEEMSHKRFEKNPETVAMILHALTVLAFEELMNRQEPNDASVDECINAVLKQLTLDSLKVVGAAAECLTLLAHNARRIGYLNREVLRGIAEKIVVAINEHLQVQNDTRKDIRAAIISRLFYCLLDWLMIEPTDLMENPKIAQIVCEVIEKALHFGTEGDRGNKAGTNHRARPRGSVVESNIKGKLVDRADRKTSGHNWAEAAGAATSADDYEDATDQIKEAAENVLNHLMHHVSNFAPPHGAAFMNR
ncbi:hypothetical protein BJ742DRAFT_901477 [Cladochytrium replicatum]|nr:hypothetical protein BJ742DRAFT_901477 [Cladochytrium replicatum]